MLLNPSTKKRYKLESSFIWSHESFSLSSHVRWVEVNRFPYIDDLDHLLWILSSHKLIIKIRSYQIASFDILGVMEGWDITSTCRFLFLRDDLNKINKKLMLPLSSWMYKHLCMCDKNKSSQLDFKWSVEHRYPHIRIYKSERSDQIFHKI